MTIGLTASSGLTTDTNIYTFSSISFGTAYADRYIVVGVVSRKAGASATISSVTIGGVSATIIEQQTNNITNTNVAGLVIALVPTGTSGNVVVTMSTTMLRCAIMVYSLVGANTYTAGKSTAAAPTTALTASVGSIGVGVATSGAATTTTWTGLTENVDATVESFTTYTSASEVFGTSGSKTMTATFGSSNESAGVFAMFTEVIVSTFVPRIVFIN